MDDDRKSSSCSFESNFLELPGGAVFHTTEVLNQFLSQPGDFDISPGRWAAVLGEAFVRYWLEKTVRPHPLEPHLRSSGLWVEFESRVLPLRERLTHPVKDILPPAGVGCESLQVWDYLKRRVTDFLTCDGILALVSGPAESRTAVGIPFVFQDRPKGPFRILDINGESFGNWEEQVGHLDRHLFSRNVELRCAGCLKEFDGGSLGLALVLAARLKSWGPIHPLEVIATGIVSREHPFRIRSVELESKYGLAGCLGAVLIAPGRPGGGFGDDFYCIDEETPMDDALGGARDFLLRKGRLQPGIGWLRQEIKDLSLSVHRRKIPSESQHKRVAELENTRRSIPGAEKYRIWLSIIRAAIANNSGDTKLSQELFEKIEKIKPSESFPGELTILRVSLLAHRATNLTDMGLFERAAEYGNKAAQIAEKQRELGIEEEQYKESLMIAYGNYGAQALLQQALRDGNEKLARKSEKYIRAGCKIAKELLKEVPVQRIADEVARDIVQVFQWKAIFRPESALACYEKVEKEILNIADHDPEDISLEYLKRHRFFAAYRCFLRDGNPISYLMNWSVPDDRIPWLLGTVLKYRGTLLAGIAECAQAIEDFELAIKLLHNCRGLTGFIGATVCLQAGESLAAYDLARARAFWNDAKKIFKSSEYREYYPGRLSSANWLKRTEGLLKGQQNSLPDPQKYFVY